MKYQCLSDKIDYSSGVEWTRNERRRIVEKNLPIGQELAL